MAQKDESPSQTDVSEVERLKQELRREHELYLRALADFDNYRRRVERERASAAQANKREILRSLIDVLDGFDRALQQISGMDQSVLDGMRMIQRQLLSLLQVQGVTPFQSLGQRFDPAQHEAADSVESDEYEPGFVIEELSRGYRWGDEVFRPARVRVAK